MTTNIVYKATCSTGKSYIGFTSLSLAKRKARHLALVRGGSHTMFHNALRKYGENFVWEILCAKGDLEVVKNQEIRMIQEHKTLAPFGYNMTAGGTGGKLCNEAKAKISKAAKGRKASLETRRKMSESQLARHLEHEVSKETRKKIGDAHRGKSISKEQREQISKTLEGRKLSQRHRENIAKANTNPSQETRRKMSESARRRWEKAHV